MITYLIIAWFDWTYSLTKTRKSYFLLINQILYDLNQRLRIFCKNIKDFITTQGIVLLLYQILKYFIRNLQVICQKH